MENKRHNIAWLTVLAVFLCLALWPIWSERFPPMQDYPQHLLQAQMLRVHDDPAFDYNQNFTFHLRPCYAAFTLATLFFSTFAPIEAAGKLALSLYPVLVALVVFRLGRRAGGRSAPWGALLFFPLAFNQQYFLGNINYLLSLPLLILALMDFEELLARPLSAWPALRQLLWQAALFIAHPLSYLAYFPLAIVVALLGRDQKKGWAAKVLLLLAGGFLLIAVAWLDSAVAPLPKNTAGGGIAWYPLKLTLEFFALMFNGMQWSRGPQLVPLLLWGGVFAVVLGAIVASRKEGGAFPARHAFMLIGALIAFCVFPFRLGSFTFINTRVAAIAYFLLALRVADVEFKAGWRYALVALLALTMTESIARQARVSAEVAEVLPVIERIPPNSRVLPLDFEPGSADLERHWFSPFLHVHDYYHVLIGGGFNPYFWHNALLPVQYRNGAERPAPPDYSPWDFTWNKYSSDYRYFLTRSAPDAFKSYMARRCNEVAASGKWTLYERR